MFEGMAKHLFKVIRGVEFKESFMRMTWQDAMKQYGSDKPDLRFGMKFVELMDIMKGHGFSVFDNAAYIGGICAEGAASYTRKQLDALTEFVKRPQVGAKGLVYARVEADGNVKSSVDKFYSQEVLQEMKNAFGAKPGDLILILSGDDAMKTRKQLCELRLEMGNQLGLRDKDKFVCLWVIDFPLFEWNEDDQRFYAMHHPFTSPNPDDIPLLDTDPGAVRANAYDMVINGVEVGGGSIRIHDSQLQDKMFKLHRRKSARAIRFLDECVQVRSASSWRFGLWLGSFRVFVRRFGFYPRLYRFPEEQFWTRCYARCSGCLGSGPVGRTEFDR